MISCVSFFDSLFLSKLTFSLSVSLFPLWPVQPSSSIPCCFGERTNSDPRRSRRLRDLLLYSTCTTVGAVPIQFVPETLLRPPHQDTHHQPTPSDSTTDLDLDPRLSTLDPRPGTAQHITSQRISAQHSTAPPATPPQIQGYTYSLYLLYSSFCSSSSSPSNPCHQLHQYHRIHNQYHVDPYPLWPTLSLTALIDLL